jgi:hypothetical protein
MQNNIIPFVHAQASEVFVSTHELFSGFGYKEHRLLKRVIEAHLEDFKEAGKIQLSSVDASQSNNPEQTYHLNEEQFTLLCLLVKNSPSAVKIKKAIAKEFISLRNYLPTRTTAIKDKRQSHAPMMIALEEARADLGKETREDNYMAENKLCNFMVVGRYIGVCQLGGEDGLTNYEIELLAQVRKRNEAYILSGLVYQDRKKKLIEFSKKYRSVHIDPSPRPPLLALVD